MNEAPLSLIELNQLFHAYSNIELIDAKRNDAAFANDVYDLINSSGQGYVMKVLKAHQDPKTINLETHIQTRLNAAGIKTPQYLDFGDNNFIGEQNECRFTLSRRIKGKIPIIITSELVFDFGATLARIHDCLKNVTIPLNRMQWFNPEIAQAALDACEELPKDKLTMLVNKGTELFSLRLPEATIHGDLWLGNTFAEKDKVTAVFDFERAQNTARIIDLARTYASMRKETVFPVQQIIDLLTTGYDSTAAIPLTRIENDNFKLAIAYVSGVIATWHATNGNRYTRRYIEIGEELTEES
jgi:Ser/Thr protein kinase RdoA (MazF antagonist)